MFVTYNDFLVVHSCSYLLPCIFTNLLKTDISRHYWTSSSMFTSILFDALFLCGCACVRCLGGHALLPVYDYVPGCCVCFALSS